MEIDEIRNGLIKPGKSKSGLAAAIGKSPSTITAILDGRRQIKLEEVPKIRRYLETEVNSVSLFSVEKALVEIFENFGQDDLGDKEREFLAQTTAEWLRTQELLGEAPSSRRESIVAYILKEALRRGLKLQDR